MVPSPACQGKLRVTSVPAQRAQTAEPLQSVQVFHEAAPILRPSQLLPAGTMLALGCGLLEVERFQYATHFSAFPEAAGMQDTSRVF